MQSRFFTLGLFLCCLTGLLQAQPLAPSTDPLKPKENDLVRIAELLDRTFSNEKQKLSNDVMGSSIQHIISKRVWKKNKEQGTWVFIRWINVDKPEEPLTSVFLNFQMGWEDTLFMQIYPVPEEIYVDGEYRRPNSEKPYADCQPKDLIELSNCGYRMLKRGENHFEILHNDDYCPFENGYSPVPFFDIHMRIQPKGLFFNTVFFDLNQRKVFQYEDQSYLPIR